MNPNVCPKCGSTDTVCIEKDWDPDFDCLCEDRHCQLCGTIYTVYYEPEGAVVQ